LSLRRLRLLVVLTLALVPVAAPAQPHKAEARELYNKAMRHYELGEFDVAIDEFKRAYELSAAPGLLFNLGQVYRMKKDYAQALHCYRTYLRLLPAANNRSIVESLIAEVQTLDERQRASHPSPPEPPPALTTAPTTPSTLASPPPAPEPPASAPPPPAATVTTSASAPRSRWRVKLWIGGAGAALGLGTLATGIGLGARSAADADQLSRASAQGGQPWDDSRQTLYRDGQRLAIAATVLDAVGGALVAGGALVVGLALRERARVHSVALVPAPGGAGVACAF
jgi:tetratricopeptide (TPR) repeat protein